MTQRPLACEKDRIVVRLRARRGSFAFDVDVNVPGRGVTAFMGPSGAGKSTCFRLLAGLDVGHGRIEVCGAVWQDDERSVFVPVHRRSVGYVFQDHVLFPHLSVGGNLEYASRRARSSPRIERETLLSILGIAHLLERRPQGLSGGERQRVAIAQALLAQPTLLLLDEPLAALDGPRKTEILLYLDRLRTRLSVPIFYVSHALDEIARLADYIVLLADGRSLASGPAREILARLDLPTTQGDDAGVTIEATVDRHDDVHQLSQIAFDGEHLWVARLEQPVGSPVRARALARDVSLALEPPGASSILNVLPATVLELRDQGPDGVIVRLSVGTSQTPLLSRVTHRSRAALALACGLRLYAQIKSVALFA